MDQRRKRVEWGPHGTRSVTSYQYWRKVLSWDREAKIAGKRLKVFCASLADVFEDYQGQVIDSKGNGLFWPQYRDWKDFESRNDGLVGTVFESLVGSLIFDCEDCDGIPCFSHYTKEQLDIRYDHDYGDHAIIANAQHKKSFFKPLTIDIIRMWLFKLMERTTNLDWLVLTKRPENIRKMVPDHWKLVNKYPSNIWIGTSVENQKAADERIPFLLEVPAVIRFLSCEPLLGMVNLEKYLYTRFQMGGDRHEHNRIDWVIAGGESGNHARPMHSAWLYWLRDQCKSANVAFFFKQRGEYGKNQYGNIEATWVCSDGTVLDDEQDYCPDCERLFKVGKKKAGRLLDGCEHNEFPFRDDLPF